MTAPDYAGIATAEQNYAHAALQQRLAAAEVEDARAAVARAQEELNRVHNTVDSTNGHGAPQHIQQDTTRLAEPAEQRLAAAQQRLAAWLDFQGKIQAVVATAAEDTQHMGVLFGTWYGNPGSAEDATATPAAANA